MSYPITLVTGAGGSGKTLWVVQEVERLRQETGRPVYYHHIPEVALDWQHLEDPHQWPHLPPGAIFVIDEAHKFFPQRGPGKPPDFVEAFAELRHRGFSAYLITQELMSLDNFIRKRTNRHLHFKRKFNWEKALVYEWQELGDPNDERSKQAAIKKTFRFPRHLYGTYKSADVHTIQKKTPWLRFAGIAALALIPLLIAFLVLHNLNGSTEPAPPPPAQQQPAPEPKSILSQAEQEALSWAVQFKERMRGQPHSAPFYDASLGARTFPKISGCGEVRYGDYYKCWCNTQQGTIITTLTPAECRFYLKNGWFDPTQDEDQEEGGSKGRSELATFNAEEGLTGREAGQRPAAPGFGAAATDP